MLRCSIRITSYNVCYTKLLRLALDRLSALMLVLTGVIALAALASYNFV